MNGEGNRESKYTCIDGDLAGVERVCGELSGFVDSLTGTPKPTKDIRDPSQAPTKSFSDVYNEIGVRANNIEDSIRTSVSRLRELLT